MVGVGTFLAVGRRASMAFALAALVLALAGYAALLAGAARSAGPGRAPVAAAGIALLALAVAAPPVQSQDLHLYAMQGRIVAAHGDNPYLHEPREYPDDPWLQRVAPPYHRGRAFYGPAFVALAAGGAATWGGSPLAGRVFFQGVAALAVLAAMILVARTTHGPGPLAFLGLNPALLVRGVNEGHVDVLLGLAVLVAVVLLGRRRLLAGGVALGAAALVKVLAVLPLAAAVAWAWRRSGWRGAAPVATGGGLVTAAGYLAAGGTRALAPLRATADDLSRSSVWARARGSLPGPATTTFGRLALVAVLALAAVLVAAAWRDRTPVGAVAGALTAYLLVGPYVLPWYAAAVLATAALRWRTGLALVVAAHSGLLLLAYVYRADGSQDAVAVALRAYVHWALPALQLVAVAALVAMAAHRARSRRSPPVPLPGLSPA